jgi:glycosyltransferase involved in cell wall biosynthesis
LASDIAPLREIGGDGALFSDTRDLAKFSELLYTITTTTEVREKLIASGIQQTKRFSWHTSANDLLDVYTSLDNF